jgi:hypothetical protein
MSRVPSAMSTPRSEAEIVAELETILADLEARLDERASEAAGDPVAADELFVLSGQLDAALREASEHLHRLRATLDRAARSD